MSRLGRYGENVSIMIPNFNGAKYLGETIASIKAQGERLADAQIEILDNCSTDNSEEVARNAWGHRVTFHRHNENIGAIANFNACVARAEREWVQILHSDDFLLPGAYEELDECLKDNTISAVFGRCVFTNDKGFWIAATSLLGSQPRGCFSIEPDMWQQNPLQYAGVLVSKSAYKAAGSFNTNRPYVSDWEMWWHIAQNSFVFYSNKCIGAYRVHKENASSRLQRSGSNIRESIELLDIIKNSFDSLPKTALNPYELYSATFQVAIQQSYWYLDDLDAFRANTATFALFPRQAVRKRLVYELYMQYWKKRLKTCLEK